MKKTTTPIQGRDIHFTSRAIGRTAKALKEADGKEITVAASNKKAGEMMVKVAKDAGIDTSKWKVVGPDENLKG